MLFAKSAIFVSGTERVNITTCIMNHALVLFKLPYPLCRSNKVFVNKICRVTLDLSKDHYRVYN